MPSATLPAFKPPPLPLTFAHTQPEPELVYQGAEALIYKTTCFGSVTVNPTVEDTPPGADSNSPIRPAALKHRPVKPYRHPQLDAKLTRHRMLAEARVLVKLRKDGVSVPAVYALDWIEGWMLFEWIDGAPVRRAVDQVMRPVVEEQATHTESVELALQRLMQRIGKTVGKAHAAGVVHGDLTTSNLMLRPPVSNVHGASQYEDSAASQLEGDIVLIDFGLSAQSSSDEDRAVDLYVLERAFGSSHPKTEHLWQQVLEAYGGSYKGARNTLKKLHEVRMRGRKKIMIG